jgi:uncharacterized protein (DUF3820 family)
VVARTRSQSQAGRRLREGLLIPIAMDSDSLQHLVAMEMPYGKYKGRVLADLPGNYLNWFARQGFPSGELGRLLALMHEIDHNGLKPLLDPLRRDRAAGAA